MIWAELQRLPAGFMEQILEYRAYAATKAMNDAATTPESRKTLPPSTLLNQVIAIEFELAQES